MGVKKSIKFRNLTAKQFEDHFHLDSPGYFIARDALKAGEVATPLEVLEVLCLANHLYANILLERMLIELKPYGKGAEYLERRNDDDIGEFVVSVIGKERAADLLREVMAEVRSQCKIGTGENEKAAGFTLPPP